MSLETASYIHQLNSANPSGSDKLAQGDDHIRLLKAVIKATFPNVAGPVTLSHTAINALSAYLVPVGAIMLWNGAAAPTGWALCDGGTYPLEDGSGNVTTPDLRGRVPAGVSGSHALGSTWGQESRTVTSGAGGAHNHTGSAAAGGAHSHGGVTGNTTLTEAQIPAHRHLMAKFGVSNNTLTNVTSLSQERTAGGDTEYVLMGNSAEPDVGRTSATGGGQAHNHSITAEGTHTHTLAVDAVPGHAHSVTVEVTQPSIALNYIMKL